MDGQGWIPIPIIATFNRVKVLTHLLLPGSSLEDAVDLIAYVTEYSQTVELNFSRFSLRSREWKDWVAPQVQLFFFFSSLLKINKLKIFILKVSIGRFRHLDTTSRKYNLKHQHK